MRGAKMGRARAAGLLLVIAVLTLDVVLALNPSSSPSSTPSAATPATTTAPKPVINKPVVTKPKSSGIDAALLGDSYTAGIGASKVSNGYPYVLARAEHWSKIDVVGLPGAGYVQAATKQDVNIGSAIPHIIALKPKVVIVMAGRDDVGAGSPAEVQAAAFADLQALRAGLPKAKIIAVGPLWPSGSPVPGAVVVRAAIDSAAHRVKNVDWVDPIHHMWFTGLYAAHTGNAATMISADGIQPNDLGYAHIAQLLQAELTSVGVK